MAADGQTVNLPNSITVARIALAPLFVYLLLISPDPNSWQHWLATFVFVLAISTDGILKSFTIVAFAAPGVPVPFVAGIIDCGGTSVRGQRFRGW